MSSPTTGAPPDARRPRRRVDVVGAVAAQFSQALGSFLLQVLAARLLGAEGLAVFAVLYGLVVLGTAAVSGFVGDSLTVLDRTVPRVRAGLQWWLVVLSAGLGALAVAGLGGSGYLTVRQAVVFGLAAAVFMAEECFRRLLMATMRFWSIVVVDIVGLLGSVGVVVAVRLVNGGVTLTTFLEGLLVGQVAAMVVAVALVPRDDRWWARGVSPDRAHVYEYGGWRALQVSIRPAMLAMMRVLVIAAVGRAAYGELEAARLFVAPAILGVAGASSYLFARVAATRDVPTARLLRQGDQGAAVLTLAALGLGVIAVVLVPSLGTAVVGETFALDRWSVFGWSVYAAAGAAATPYGVLAAVRGRQGVAFAVRLAEAVAAVGGVALAMAVGWSAVTVPYVLAMFSLLGGLGLRRLIVTDVAARRMPA